jgi:hypothetical protein
MIPLAFLSFYLAVLLVVALVIISNWSVLQHNAFGLPAAKQESSNLPTCNGRC